MKKKLEAELISIAHRILKLKNRADLDQLQEETLKLYEKLSVLKFVEDHFGGAEPTIGRASAVFNLEEIYGLEEVAPVHGNEVEAEEDKARAEKKAEPKKENEDKENEGGEGVDTDGDGKAPVSAEEESEVADDAKAEEAPSPKGEQEEPEAKDAEKPAEDEAQEAKENVAEEAPEAPEAEEEAEAAVVEEKEEAPEEPEIKIQVEKPAEDIKAEEAAAASVFEKEAASTIEEEEKAADAEIKTIEPDANAKTEPAQVGFEFAFDRAEEPKKPKEVSFEDFHDYKEPEFIKKGGDAPKADNEPAPAAPSDDWRNWEPSKTPATTAEQEQPKAEEPKAEAPKPAEPVRDWRDWEPAKTEPARPVEVPKPAEAPKPVNTGLGRSITLGLNDRIAFEKNLFGGSADDLNRVISQLNTLNNFDEARILIWK